MIVVLILLAAALLYGFGFAVSALFAHAGGGWVSLRECALFALIFPAGLVFTVLFAFVLGGINLELAS